jgi:hypothetical protein
LCVTYLTELTEGQRMTTDMLIQYVAAAIFGLAVLHTFSTKFFISLAHKSQHHAGLWHLLGKSRSSSASGLLCWLP